MTTTAYPVALTPADEALRELLIAAADYHGGEGQTMQAYDWAVCGLADVGGAPNPSTVLRALGWKSPAEAEVAEERFPRCPAMMRTKR